MKTRTVLNGNAFYEIDEECLERKQKAEMEKELKKDQKKQSRKQDRE